MIRNWLIVLVWLFGTATALSKPVLLVLISPDRAGPRIDEADYVHQLWIRWPDQFDRQAVTLLKSLATGIKWYGPATEANSGKRVSESRLQALNRIGAMVLIPDRGPPPTASLFIANRLTFKPIRIRSLKDSYSSNAIVIAEARSWDEVVAWSRTIGNRTLLIEYPPRTGSFWSRMWLYGDHWPEGVPRVRGIDIPGLIPSTEAITLLSNPESLIWGRVEAGWTGANRWLIVRQGTWKFLSGFIVVLIGVMLGWAGVLFGQERASRSLQFAFGLVLGIPAWMVAFGQWARLIGIEYWPVASAVLAGLGGLLALIMWHWDSEYQTSNQWVTLALASTGTLSLLDPRWSPLSGQFTSSGGNTPAIAWGAWFASYALLHYYSPSRFRVFLTASLLLAGLLFQPWWVDPDWRWVCLLGLPYFANADWKWLLMLVLVPSAAVMKGIQFAPGGISLTGLNVHGLNLAEWLDLALSPLFIVLVVGTVLALVTISEFGKHRMRGFWRQYGEMPYLAKMAMGALALAVLSPKLAEVACVVYFAMITLISVRSLGPTKVVVSEHFGGE